jgi:hypothetical protein
MLRRIITDAGVRIAAFACASILLFGQDQSPLAPPQYFDQRNFIVAGVADPSQRGGHGSDPVLRSAETLAKETASLRKGNSAADAEEKQGNALEAAAEQRFFEAADLNPSDPAPYAFLGKISIGPITESPGFAEQLERFSRLQPENAWANYYYAATLARTSPKARALLEKTVRLDPKHGDAFLLLGIVYAEEGNLSKPISANYPSNWLRHWNASAPKLNNLCLS